jgi:hypothetical protein
MEFNFNENNFGITLLIRGKAIVESDHIYENSIIFLTKQSSYNKLGVVSVHSKERGKFVIESSYYNDSDWVGYFIVNQPQ